MHGQLTAKVAEAIRSKYFDQGYEVYYDHGEADNVFVGTIAVSIEEKLSRENEISQLDIAVVEQESKHIIALIEIEETSDKPKTLIGDVFAVLMGKSIQLPRGKKGEVGDWTTLLVVGKGKGHEERYEYILKMANKAKDVFGKGTSSIGNIVIDTFARDDELEPVLMRQIEEAIKRKP